MTGSSVLFFGDNIQTGADDDTVLGGPGDDELDGDSGFDTAVYKGSILHYDVIRIDGDEVDVVDMSHNLGISGLDSGIPLDEGTDELEDFEAIRFADYTLRLDGVNNAPFIVADDLLIDENTPATLTFDAYDFDGDSLTVDSIVSENGATIDPIVTLLPPVIPSFFGRAIELPYVYTPVASGLVAGEVLTDTVTLTVTDNPLLVLSPVFPGIGGVVPPPPTPETTVVTVNVTIVGVNDPLTANDDAATVAEDGSVDIDVLANDTSDGGETLLVLEASAANGTIEIQENGELHYTPNLNFNGADTITYSIWNGTETSFIDTAEVAVTVTPVNDPPDAVADSATTDEDVPVNIDVLANDTDPENDMLTVTSAGAVNGSVVVESDNTLTYTPNLNFNGREQITYTISDGNGGTDTGFVAVTVDPVNDDPTGRTDIASPIAEDGGPIVIDVLANDSDIDGDTALFVSGFGVQVGGTAELTNKGQVRFTPDQDFFGTGIVQYFIGDGNGGTGSSIALFPVTPVNDAPTTNPGTIVAEEDDGLITIQLKDFVNDLDNDILSFSEISTDRDGDLIPFSIRDDKVQFQTFENGIITIDPEVLGLDGGESAMTTFTYTVNDNSGDPGKDTATGTIDVTINGADEPVAPSTFVGVTDLVVNADEENGPVTILLSDLVTPESIGPSDVFLLRTNNYFGSGTLFNLSGYSVIETLNGPALEIGLGLLYNQVGPTEPFPPVAGDGILSEGEMETQVLTIGVSSESGLGATATVTLNLTGDTPGIVLPTDQPPTGGGDLGDIIVDDPANTTLTFDLDNYASDDYFETNPTDSPLAFTIGTLTVGGDDEVFTVTDPNLTFDNSTNVVTLDLAFIELFIDDGGNSPGVLDFTISDGTFTTDAQITVNFVDPLDVPPEPEPEPTEFLLDFEEFSDDSGSSISIGFVEDFGLESIPVSHKGFFFQGPAAVIETDELDVARAGDGILSGQTTPDGDNVLLAGTKTEVPLALVDLIDPLTGSPYLHPFTGDPVQGVPGSTVVLDEFGQPLVGPDGSVRVDDSAVPTTELVTENTVGLQSEGGTLVPGAAQRTSTLAASGLEDDIVLEALFGLAPDTEFNLDGLSLNVTGDGMSQVTLTTYRYEVTETPITGSFSTYTLDVVEVDSFVFDADAATGAEMLDFNDASFADDSVVPKTDRTAFDDIQAVVLSANDDSFIVLDDVMLSSVEDVIPI